MDAREWDDFLVIGGDNGVGSSVGEGRFKHEVEVRAGVGGVGDPAR